MTPRVRSRDVRRTRCAEQRLALAAADLIEAYEAAIAPLHAVAAGGQSVGAALDVLERMHAAEPKIRYAETIYWSCLLLGGATHHGVARAAGYRPPTVSRRVAALPAATLIATATRDQVVKSRDGKYRINPSPTARRRVPEAEL